VVPAAEARERGFGSVYVVLASIQLFMHPRIWHMDTATMEYIDIEQYWVGNDLLPALIPEDKYLCANKLLSQRAYDRHVH